MKKIEVQTKNGGNIMVPVFDKMEEAVKEYGTVEILKKVNRMVRVDLVNQANVKQSLMARLNKAKREGKVTEAQIENLLKVKS